LTFSYIIGAGQNASALTAAAVNLNSASITDGAGNAANLSLSGLTQNGPQIDTTAPAAPVVTSDVVNWNDSVSLSGTAQANSTVEVFSETGTMSHYGARDGGIETLTALGTTTTNAGGSWSFVTGVLTSGSYTFFATATDAAGNTSPLSAGLDPVVGQPATSAANSATLTANGTMEIDQASSANVAFQTNSPGILELDQPSIFTGTVSGFGAQNAIDLPGITFAAQTTLGYLPNSNHTGGTLSLTDGSHSANIALLGNYMASSFAVIGDNHGGSMVVAEAAQSGNQSLLTNPQHT